MRKERKVLADRIISMNRDLRIAERAGRDGLLSEYEVAWMVNEIGPDKAEAEEAFLATYTDEKWGRPTWAANLGVYDQYQRDNAAGLYR